MKTLAQLAQECGFNVDENATISSIGNMNVRLHAFRAACRAEALEEAAQRCDQIKTAPLACSSASSREHVGLCAAAIREMK